MEERVLGNTATVWMELVQTSSDCPFALLHMFCVIDMKSFKHALAKMNTMIPLLRRESMNASMRFLAVAEWVNSVGVKTRAGDWAPPFPEGTFSQAVPQPQCDLW